MDTGWSTADLQFAQPALIHSNVVEAIETLTPLHQPRSLEAIHALSHRTTERKALRLTFFSLDRRSVRHQDRDLGAIKHVLGYATEEEFPQSAMRVGAHDKHRCV